jgi:hypothetical protein
MSDVEQQLGVDQGKLVRPGGGRGTTAGARCWHATHAGSQPGALTRRERAE